MQSITALPITQSRSQRNLLSSTLLWLQKNEPVWEENRFGIVASSILLQVSIAGFTVFIPPMAGASIWSVAAGVFFAFMSNSIAFAQIKMRWVLLGFSLSILVNASVSLFYFIRLLN